jgi:hypothetical protein
MAKTEPLTSLNHLHEAGRNERRSIAFDAGIIFIGGFIIWAILIFLLIGPAWLIRGADGLAITTRVPEAFSLLALDAAGLAPFVGIAAVVLALNRFDRHSPDELGLEDAIRLWTRLDFRAIVQFALILVAATAPYRAITWMLMNTSDFTSSRQVATSAGSCVILWLLLLLAGPTNTTFGLQGVQRQWHLAHVLHKAGHLERAWGQRWGQGIYGDVKQRRLPVRIGLNWLSLIATAIAIVVAATAITTPAYEFWTDHQYSRLLIVVGIYLAVCGLFGLAGSVAFALLSLRLLNEERSGASRLAKWIAYSFPFLFVGGTATALGTLYVPVLAGTAFIGCAQFLCSHILLRKGCVSDGVWNPISRLAWNIANRCHQQAVDRIRLLQAHWASGLARLPRREAKRVIKQAKEWRGNHRLELPFLD